MNTKKRAKKLVITAGILGLMMFTPTAQSNPLGEFMGTMTTYAAEQNQSLPYSHRWETQVDGNWKYKMDDGSYAVNKWIQDEVDKNWYLMDANGVMETGIVESYGKYYILSEVHDGHYGHLVKNGEVYHGVAIKASTNADDEGALSSETIAELKNAGACNFSGLKDVSGTAHATDGQVVSGNNAVEEPVDTSSSTYNLEADLDGDGHVSEAEEQLSDPDNMEELLDMLRGTGSGVSIDVN